jgi:hypothetical protein
MSGTKKLHADFIEEIKQNADIVDIISGHIELKKRGKDYVGLCPFHDEKTPSFSVSPTKKVAYCFGCTWGGNALKFLMELNRASFFEAVLDLARSTNIPVRYEDGSTEYDYPDPLPRPLAPKPLPAKEEKENSESKDYTVDEWRVNRSVERLLSGTGDAAKALGWLQQRGITREMIKRYRLGLEKRVVTPNESNPERKETYWAIAIFIPVPSRSGRFYVKKRVAPWLSDDERPSYLGKWTQFGVPATIWFTQNPDEAQETWFCEGEWDAIKLGELARQRGKKIAVACSTAGAGSLPKQEQLDRLPGAVTSFFDRDEAGTKGAQKLAEALGERGRIALVPMGGDSDQKGWDVSNALDADYTWEDFEAAASLASCYIPPTEKDESSGDRPISRDEWELNFGFGKRLRERVKRALGGFKGFGKSSSPQPRPKETPDQLFQHASDRLKIWQDAVAKGYRYILDNSATGLGKSHAVGVAVPEEFGAEKLYYLSSDHRNPTTGAVEDNYTDLPVRHGGLKIDHSRKTPNGNPFLVWPQVGEEPDTRPNCFRYELFQHFRAKNFNVEASGSSPICKSCKLAYLCKEGTGGKYRASFRGDRKTALAADRIRAHADSMSSAEALDYSNSVIFWDEAEKQLNPIKQVPLTLEDFDRTWAKLEEESDSLYKTFKGVRLALRPLLTGKAKQPYHGWDDAAIRALLPDPLEVLSLGYLRDHDEQSRTQILQHISKEYISVLQGCLQPDFSFLKKQPDQIGKKEASENGISGAMRKTVNSKFRKEAHEEFAKGLQNLPLNWLVPLLKVWVGIEKGAFRCEKQELTIFTHSDRQAAIARAAKSNIFLDATATKEQLALQLGIDPEEIYVVSQKTPNHKNLKIIQITGMGKLGKDRSESLKGRVAALKRALKELYPNTVFGDRKAHTEAGDGQWFVNLRGSNEFQDAPAMAVFGIPYQNVGYLQALYQTLTGEFAPLDRESPHEGLQRFIEEKTQAEIKQAVGRLRSHLRPDEELIFIFVGDYDLSFLECEIEQIEAFKITPEAGTPAQITRWKILEAIRQLREQGEKVTQQAIASLAEISQPTIAKIAARFGGWKRLLKILLALLDPLYSDSNNFDSLTDEEKCLAQTYLPCLLDEPPEDAVRKIGDIIQTHGILAFLRILSAATPQTQARLLALMMRALPLNEQSELMLLVEGGG